MKKSILNFGGIMLVLISVFGCNHEQEFIKTSDEQLKAKGKIYEKGEVDHETATVTITDLLTSQHKYISEKIADNFKYCESLPERRDSDWFHKHFDYLFKENTEVNEWVIQNIDSKKILIFGGRVNETKVASLVFSDDMTMPKEFENKSGLILDTNTFPDCGMWCEYGYIDRGPGCNCWMTFCCDGGTGLGCHEECPDESEIFHILDKIFPDNWGLDFESLGAIPVHNIKIGEPVLQ